MGEFAKHISPIILAVVLAACVWIIYCLNRKHGNTYFARDLLIDHKTGRADLDKHILIAMALVSLWVVVVKTLGLYKGEQVDTLLLGVLGVFVLKRMGSAWIDSKTPTETTTVTATSTKIVDPDAAAESRP